jgi:hypothetical protein
VNRCGALINAYGRPRTGYKKLDTPLTPNVTKVVKRPPVPVEEVAALRQVTA